MLKPFKSLLLLAVFAILAACTANPITGRNQFLVVSENQAIGESAAAYSQMMGQLDKKKKIEPEGERTKSTRPCASATRTDMDRLGRPRCSSPCLSGCS